jgi:hypothetical protein
VQRVNLNTWIFIGANLDRVSSLQATTPANAAVLDLIRIAAVCEFALEDEVSPIDFSANACRALLEAAQTAEVHGQRQIEAGKGANPIEPSLIDDVKSRYARFRNLFNEELSRKNIYAVRESEIYSVSSLIEKGDSIIPASLRSDLPKLCLDELRQAGRCLAFELATASAFHIMRSIEVVLLDYWDVVTKLNRPDNRNWGVLLKGIKDGGGDQTVIDAVAHVKDLHRNPIVHPELTLSMDEALVLWGAAPSVLVAVEKDILKKRSPAVAVVAIST